MQVIAHSLAEVGSVPGSFVAGSWVGRVSVILSLGFILS